VNCHEASRSVCDVPPAVCSSSRKIEVESCRVVLRSALPPAARWLEPPARISRTLYTQRIPVADIVKILPFRSPTWPNSQVLTQGRETLRVCLCFLSTTVSGCLNKIKSVPLPYSGKTSQAISVAWGVSRGISMEQMPTNFLFHSSWGPGNNYTEKVGVYVMLQNFRPILKLR
jgi:hypothetical protein